MSNKQTAEYFSCSERTMADSQLHYTSGGYSSGSDSDDTEAAPSLETTTITEGIVKQQQMYIYSKEYEKWHECDLILRPPHLQLKEYEDTKLEIQERQLQHIHKRWFHGNISRREAKYILQDYGGGEGSFLVRTSESYRGKFAISFVHEERVKHVVIETKPDSVTGVVYHITPKGPFFNSLNGLIEEAKNTCIIQNHAFDVILTKSPPKPDFTWLHTNIKTLSQAEHLMGKDAYSTEGSFIVYPTTSPLSPYSLVYRSNGNVIHANVMSSQRSSHGFNLNGVTAPVLYKLVHYFMENPVYSDTVLRQCPVDKESYMSNSAIAIQDFTGDCDKNELSFHNGDLITNISRRSIEWCVGDHRGDKQKFFPTSFVRFLSKDELQYIRDVKSFYQKSSPNCAQDAKTHTLNLRTDYTVSFDVDGLSSIINIEPIDPTKKELETFKLSCTGCRDVEKWYQELERTDCISTITTNTSYRKTSVNSSNGVDSHIGRRTSRRKVNDSCLCI